MDEFKVRNGRQRLTFNGELLSKSTSKRRDSPRWVEFELFRTKGGNYVLSRIGQTNVFHGPACEVLERGDDLFPAAVTRDATPCELCVPQWDDDITIPESPRYWAQVMETPMAVLESLYRYDNNGARYLTRVARELLEDAAKKDPELEDVYYLEPVD